MIAVAWNDRGDTFAVRTQQATILAGVAGEGVPRFATLRERREPAGARWEEAAGLTSFRGRWRGWRGVAEE